jgi:hypothetical protein
MPFPSSVRPRDAQPRKAKREDDATHRALLVRVFEFSRALRWRERDEQADDEPEEHDSPRQAEPFAAGICGRFGGSFVRGEDQ